MPTQTLAKDSLNTKLLLKALVAFKKGDFSVRLPGEWTGEAGKIQVSQDIYQRLRDDFELESRGEIDVKGKGRMPTWFLVARKPLAVAQPSEAAG